MLLEDFKHKELYREKEKELRSKIDEVIIKINEYERLQNDNIDYSNNLKKLEEVFNSYNKLDKFNRKTFDSIVEKIMVGEYDENGNFNSKVIRFVLKMKRDIVFDLSALNILDKNVSLSNIQRSKTIWSRTCKQIYI